MEQRSKILIDTKAIENNINIIKKLIKPSTKIMAVVKADGYGHGAIEAAKAAIRAGVEYLGVATASEGIQLRKNDINANILVLGAAFSDCISKCVEYNLTQTVFDYKTAELIAQTATHYDKRAVIHIKVDTGMNRIGFFPSNESLIEIEKISRLQNIYLEGIYSHFAESDSQTKNFSDRQAENFIDFCNKIEDRGIIIPIKHMSNSAAVLTLPQYQFDMVRPGIIIYGLSPSNNINLKKMDFQPALSYYSVVSFIKTVSENISVGYNRTFFTSRDSRIATIPIGYADAYPRALSNKGRVIINGKYAPIVGNICMDQMMVDVTGVDCVEIGSDVILIGKQGNCEVTIDYIAKKVDTINYEITCAIGNGVRSEKIYK